MKSTLRVITRKDNFECCVVLNGTGAYKRKMEAVTVKPHFYESFISQLVRAGWILSDGAEMNLQHQLIVLGY